jgi:hypothetical protein
MNRASREGHFFSRAEPMCWSPLRQDLKSCPSQFLIL